MSVYHPFGRSDVLYSVVYTNPKIRLASGSTGWRGNIGTSSSLSLYGGIRARTNVKASDFGASGLSIYPIDPLDTHSIDKVIFVSGSYPSTGSVRFVTARRVAAASVLTDVTADDWWEEHFNPVDGLFEYYSRFNSNFFTGSYDFYNLYLKSNAAFTASCVLFSGSTLPTVTSSFTMEARVKPMSVTSSIQDFTILSQRGRFKLYIVGADGKLAFSDMSMTVTSSVPLMKGVWQHVAATVDSSTVSLYIDREQVANQAFTSSLLAYAGNLVNTASFLTVGAEHNHVIVTQFHTQYVNISVAAQTTNGSTTDGNSFITANVALPSGSLACLFVNTASGSATAVPPTRVSASAIAFTKVYDRTYDAGPDSHNFSVWAAHVMVGQTVAATMSYDASNVTATNWSLIGLSGTAVNVSGVLGVFNQTGSANFLSSSAFNINIATPYTTSSYVIGGFAYENLSAAFDPRAGYAALGANFQATPDTGLVIQGKIINGTTNFSASATSVVDNTTGWFGEVIPKTETSGFAEVTSSIPRPNHGYNGFVYETRIWNRARTFNELSSSSGRTLTSAESGSSRLVHYSRFNDGPLSSLHGFTRGSGTVEYGRSTFHGQFTNVNTVLPVGPTWHPNDDIDFTTYKTAISATLDYLKIVHVPSMFYGRQIATGSVRLVCNAYNRQGITRVIMDDGRGGLYISGSVSRASGLEDYTGVRWNKVGNVFYTEGLIVLTDPAVWDFSSVNKDWTGTPDLLQVSFDGVSRVPTKTFMCRMDPGDSNCSNNPTFHVYDDRGTADTSDDRVIPARADGTTYVTAIGIYNEDRKLVAVAKIAQPIRKREKDKNLIKLRMDF